MGKIFPSKQNATDEVVLQDTHSFIIRLLENASEDCLWHSEVQRKNRCHLPTFAHIYYIYTMQSFDIRISNPTQRDCMCGDGLRCSYSLTGIAADYKDKRSGSHLRAFARLSTIRQRF